MTEVTDEATEFEEELLYYTEKATNLLYEVKLFQDFALLRLVMPEHNTPAGRLDLVSFCDHFEPFHGDVEELKAIIHGLIPSFFQVKKYNDWNE